MKASVWVLKIIKWFMALIRCHFQPRVTYMGLFFSKWNGKLVFHRNWLECNAHISDAEFNPYLVIHGPVFSTLELQFNESYLLFIVPNIPYFVLLINAPVHICHLSIILLQLYKQITFLSVSKGLRNVRREICLTKMKVKTHSMLFTETSFITWIRLKLIKVRP